MKTFIILYRQGLKGKVLGWFGQFETEELALEAFPFPPCSTNILSVTEANDDINLRSLLFMTERLRAHLERQS
ncbi:MAG TPA: hypothetical protein VHV10_17880 [Ktedonobacteraceae bacterium]|jgi:hypothetical protein|nr:hypothetical protein [Ktedonobacteraceae bacterium]